MGIELLLNNSFKPVVAIFRRFIEIGVEILVEKSN